MSSNEHTQWSVAQKTGGWTCSQAFHSEDDAIDYVRCLLAVGGCVQLSIAKYTPTAEPTMSPWVYIESVTRRGG